MWDSMPSWTPGPLQSLDTTALATQGDLPHRAHRSPWGPPPGHSSHGKATGTLSCPPAGHCWPRPRHSSGSRSPRTAPSAPSPALGAPMAFPAPQTGSPQASAQHFRTPTVPSAPSTAPPAPIPCPTHVVECITKPLLLQLVERRVEEAEGCQPPLQAPVVDQCHHARHHRCGRLRGHNPSAQDPHHPKGQQRMSSLLRSLTPRAGGCGLSPPSSCQRAQPGQGTRGRCC